LDQVTPCNKLQGIGIYFCFVPASNPPRRGLVRGFPVTTAGNYQVEIRSKVLAKRDEISSTEKLLTLIRDKNRSELENPQVSSKPSFIRRLKISLKNAVKFKRSISIGVDIGYDDMKLVKMRNLSQQRHELVDYAKISFGSDMSPDSPDFSKFLKNNLSRFCGSSKNLQIWGNISSARVELRYLRIPKVPQKQIPNAVFWSHKKVAPYNEKEAIFDFEILGDKVENSAPKLEVVSLTAPQQEIQYLKNLFSKSGHPLKGISIVPFAVQNLLRTGWMQPNVKTVSSLYIGRDWSRIDIFSAGNLVLSRGIKAGIITMNEAMRGEIIETENRGTIEFQPEMFESPENEKRQDTTHRSKIDTRKAQQIFLELVHDVSHRTEAAGELRPEEEKIFKMILPALERLVRQVERTFEHYASNFDNKRVEKIYISSGIRLHSRIMDYIGYQLDLTCETFDPFSTDAQFLGEVSEPASDAVRGSYAPAMGMALSDNSYTPNFLFPFKEKAKAAKSRLLNKAIMICFYILAAGCFGFYYLQGLALDKKYSDVTHLKNELNAFKTRVDQKLIINLVEKTKKKNEAFREFSRKYLGIVVLSEISNLTPSNIRLISISVQLSGNPLEEDTELQKNLSLEGIILGNRMVMETALAGYLIKLSDSPLFNGPVIKTKEMGFFYDREVLRFVAQLQLE